MGHHLNLAFLRSTLGTFTLLLLSACSDSKSSATSPSVEPHLSAIEEHIFQASCTFSSCHSADTAKQGLILAGSTYAAIVNRPSTEVPERMLVLPNDPEQSYLYEKLTKDTPASGSRMPYTASPLDDGKLSAIRVWIENGAKDD